MSYSWMVLCLIGVLMVLASLGEPTEYRVVNGEPVPVRVR